MRHRNTILEYGEITTEKNQKLGEKLKSLADLTMSALRVSISFPVR